MIMMVIITCGLKLHKHNNRFAGHCLPMLLVTVLATGKACLHKIQTRKIPEVCLLNTHLKHYR